MPYANQVYQYALELANDMKERAEALKPKLNKLKTQVMQIEAQLNSANLGYDRLAVLKELIRTDPDAVYCAKCIINRGKQLKMRPSDNPDGGEIDIFKCGTCGDKAEFMPR